MNQCLNCVAVWFAMAFCTVVTAQPAATDDLKAFGIASPKTPIATPVNSSAGDAAAGAQTAFYGGDPVDIVLGTGKTLRVVFDFVGHIGVPAEIAQRLDIKTLPSGIFLTANSPFEAHVVQVRNADNTRVIPVYLSAIGTADPVYPKLPDRLTVVDGTVASPDPPPVIAKALQPVEIAPAPAPKLTPPEKPLLKETVAKVIPRARSRRNTGLVDFVRMLAQQHYGPARLANDLNGAEKLTINSIEPVRLIPGARVETTPVNSYAWRNYVGTAIEIRNPGNTDFAIDPRQFLGYWRYAAVLDRRSVIGAGETAIVFLISDRPFGEALRGVVWKGGLK